jgi:hypothetical protein
VPTIFQHKGYRAFFFANEGNPREPIHVHIRKGEAVAKFWVEPEVSLAESYAMNARELKELEMMVVAQQNIIKEKWHEFFSH